MQGHSTKAVTGAARMQAGCALVVFVRVADAAGSEEVRRKRYEESVAERVEGA